MNASHTDTAADQGRVLHHARRVGLFLFAALQMAIGAACAPVGFSETGSEKASASESLTCDGNTQGRFDTFKASQTEWYRARTSVLPAAESSSSFHQGTNGHAVVVVHGFNSTPRKQKDLIFGLASKGYTVIAPLLTGFGSNGDTANIGTEADWRKAIEDAVAVVKPCHSKVSLIGHSTGGALITDEVRTGRIAGISKIVALAPFYRPIAAAVDTAVDQVAAQYPVINASLIKEEFDLDPSLALPLGEFEGDADSYYIPVLALQKVFDLQRLFSETLSTKSNVPALVVVSKFDLAINNDFAVKYVTDNFASSDKLVYPLNEFILHSLQLRQYNPKFDSMLTKIIAHLEK